MRGALNKIPKLRPTYTMLLSHPWLSELMKPATIVEEEDEESTAPAKQPCEAFEQLSLGVSDREISEWVTAAIFRRASLGKGVAGKAPALHAAPLA